LRRREHYWALIKHWQFMMDVTFARLTTKKTGLILGLWHAKPESCAEHHAYVKSGEWVPEEADDGLARFFRRAGKLDGYLIGGPGYAFLLALAAWWARPLRRYGIALILAGLIVLIIYLHSH
jgi:hypothetical protein